MVSNTERTCKTCRYYPPEGEKWPCVDCTMSMQSSYDRWEPRQKVGIYIADTKMPESCADCFMRSECSKKGVPVISKYTKNRYEGCPISEISGSHWWLTDANAVKRYFKNCAEDRGAIRPPESWEEAFDEAVGVLSDFSIIPESDEQEEPDYTRPKKAHGWITNADGMPVCSECGRTPYCDHGGHLLKSPFCPSCGASMI